MENTVIPTRRQKIGGYLLAGAVLLWLGLHDYRVSFRLPRGRESAIQHCIAPQNLS